MPTSLLGLTEAPDMTRDGQASWGGCHHPGAEGTMSEAVSRTSWRHGSLTGPVPPGENTATADPVHRDERAASCQAPQGNPGEAERESVSPPAAERPEQRVCLTWPRSQGWVCGAIPRSLPTFLPRHPEQRTSCDVPGSRAGLGGEPPPLSIPYPVLPTGVAGVVGDTSHRTSVCLVSAETCVCVR